MQNSASFALQVASIVLIVVATRWLFAAKGPTLPRTRDGISVYGIKWQWRAVGFAGGAFWVVMSIWSLRDMHSRGVIIVITGAFVAAGLWLASGSVTTNQKGITKKVLWWSRTFHWGEITEIRLYKKQIGAIELRAGGQKLAIDSRFVAFQHLLNEIEDQTKLQPSVQ